jgi:BirA family transcriptional regulator, biotin operon repressor / biotin---[acetyl-CoA-carboxylase] ligase
LVSASLLDLGLLRSQLGTRFFAVGDRLLYRPVVDSTNVLAMRIAHEGLDEGVVVLTDSQTAGKGRQGRRWVDVSGRDVLSSTLLRPFFPPHLLVMIASLAVVNAIAETCGISATIKWPNDILIEGHKVAGILIETSHDQTGRMVAVVGIGINVNGQIADYFPAQAALFATATTLETACGHGVSRETLIAHLLRHLETDYLALQQEYTSSSSVSNETYRPIARLIRERWRSQIATLGRTIQVQQGERVVSGVAEDVDDNGELLLRCHSGELVSITWGDVGYPLR